MGVIVKERRPGEWWLYISHNGKRKAKKIGRDKRKAEEAAKQIEARLVLGDFNMAPAKSVPTFEKYAQLWLEDYIKNTKRPTTYLGYKGLLTHHIFPVIGNIQVHDLKRSDIRGLLLKINRGGRSKRTVMNAKNVISGVLDYAIEEEILKVNVSKGVLRKLGIESNRDQHIADTFTPEEVDLFLETCLRKEPRWYHLFLTAFRTGMRLGELLGLEWGDVDFNGSFIQVQRAFKNGRLTPTKTGRVRRVDMSRQLHTELSRLLFRRKEEALKAGSNQPAEIVFHTDGKHTPQNSARAAWARVLTKAGLSHRRIHDARHTFASILLSSGVSPAYVKEQLGHSSIQITVDVYGHLIPGSNRNAVDLLDSKSLQLSATHTQPKNIVTI